MSKNPYSSVVICATDDIIYYIIPERLIWVWRNEYEKSFLLVLACCFCRGICFQIFWSTCFLHNTAGSSKKSIRGNHRTQKQWNHILFPQTLQKILVYAKQWLFWIQKRKKFPPDLLWLVNQWIICKKAGEMVLYSGKNRIPSDLRWNCSTTDKTMALIYYVAVK